MYVPINGFTVIVWIEHCLFINAVYRYIMLCCPVQVYLKYADLPSYCEDDCSRLTIKSYIYLAPCNTDTWTYIFLLFIFTRQFQTHNIAWYHVQCLVKSKPIYYGTHKRFGVTPSSSWIKDSIHYHFSIWQVKNVNHL
jgi:hypothetical protein